MNELGLISFVSSPWLPARRLTSRSAWEMTDIDRHEELAAQQAAAKANGSQ